MEGNPQYMHHWRHYGHPSKHGWKDMVQLWKAERFDPDALMQLYVDAGAKYFVAQGVHHDNFDNWDSKHHRWNAVQMGPKKDIVGLWRDAARKRGLRFGVTEHLGASYTWYEQSKKADQNGPYSGVPYDANDPHFEDLYHDNRTEALLVNGVHHWYTANPAFHEQWFKRIKDLVDQHQPDLLGSDGGLPFVQQEKLGDQHPIQAFGVDCPRAGLDLVAHLYNLSASAHGGRNEAVYTHKDSRPEIASIGVLEVERGQLNEPTPRAWQNATCVGGWFYDVRQVYKTPKSIVETLVDVVSKNGNLLLNVTQRPDGTFDDECLYILKALAAWMKVNGEGIHGTRPWSVDAEGPTRVFSKLWTFKEDAVAWTTADFRFTRKGKNVYVFQMAYPERRHAFIRSLGSSRSVDVKGVHVLGAALATPFRQYEDGLLVELPEVKVCDPLPCIKVELD